MANTVKNKTICVLGMHRSGTSAVARALNLLGVYLGEPEHIVNPRANINPKGYWEHRGIVDIHEQIFNTLGRTWRDLRPLDNEWWKLQSISGLREDLINLLIREFADKPLWGWKDPRTCLMLPMWEEILEELGTEVGYLIVFRNPIDIANSLMKRDNSSANQSYSLWTLYTLTALEETKNKNRTIISYDEYVNNWHPSLKKIAAELDIPWPHDKTRLNQEMESFLDTDLRHNHSSLDDLSEKVRSAELPESMASLYKLCLKAANEQDFINSEEFITEINSMYSEHITCAQTIGLEFRQPLQNKPETWNRKLTKPLRWLAKLRIR